MALELLHWLLSSTTQILNKFLPCTSHCIHTTKDKSNKEWKHFESSQHHKVLPHQETMEWTLVLHAGFSELKTPLAIIRPESWESYLVNVSHRFLIWNIKLSTYTFQIHNKWQFPSASLTMKTLKLIFA